LLALHFAMDYAARMHKRITGISEKFMKALVRHSWPGNVRELQNVIERSAILSSSGVVETPPPDTGWLEVVEDIHALHLVGWADFAHSSDAPRNERGDRGSERRCRPAGHGPDDVDLQNEAARHHGTVTQTWSGYLKGLIFRTSNR
jgi:DNA-binding NtrC family response regulator